MSKTLHSKKQNSSAKAATLAALTALSGVFFAPHLGRAQSIPPASDAGTATPPVVSPTYVLAPLDVLDISVQGHEDYHTSTAILADGTFNYPTIGAIHAAGLTVAQLRTLIVKGLSDYFNQPDVTVAVRESHIQKITVSGVARTPGLYDYRPGITLLEVVSASGGSSQAPESTGLSVVTRKNNQETSVPIDLVSLLAGDQSQNIALSPGDTLLFTQRDPAKSAVQIVGQVNRPGQFTVMRQGATLISMLTEAGGTTPSAVLTRVQLVRNGKTYVYNLHDTLFNIDDPSGQIKIYAGDTINVPFNNTKVAVQGEVRAPSIYVIPDGEPLTLSTALAQAGGPTTEGDKKDVGIFRLGKDNQRHFIEFNLEQLYKSKPDAKTTRLADVPLQDKDIIVVPTRHHGHSALDYVGSVGSLSYLGYVLGAPIRR